LNLGIGNISTAVSVLKDDSFSVASAGFGISLDRNGSASASLEVSISDSDNGRVVSEATACSIWVTTNGVNMDGGHSSLTTGNICSYDFNPDSNYAVGPQNFSGGVFGDLDYNDFNSSNALLTLVGEMTSSLQIPNGTQKYRFGDSVNFRWNISGDAGENVVGVSNNVEIISTLGVATNVCTAGNVVDEGNGFYNCDYVVPFDLDLDDYEFETILL